MDAYTGFAQVYDSFMDNVPYEAWSERIVQILHSYGIEDGLVLDLCCGTGVLTRLLEQAGYDMIGVDLSLDMLEEARSHEDTGILYLLQDMREFELYGTVRAVVCTCDSLNYLLEEEELLHVFSLVNNYLDPEGIFIFDVNTVYKFREILADSVICDNRETECFTWENTYDAETRINEYAMNFFVQTESGLYERFEEYHYQKAYERERIEELLAASGLQLLAVYGADGAALPEETSDRLWFVAREHGKAGKRLLNG